MNFFPSYEKMGEDEYKHKKLEIIDAYLDVLEEHYPGIHELVEYAEVGTPRTMRRYLRTPSGTAYGFAPSSAQFFRRPQVRSELLRAQTTLKFHRILSNSMASKDFYHFLISQI